MCTKYEYCASSMQKNTSVFVYVCVNKKCVVLECHINIFLLFSSALCHGLCNVPLQGNPVELLNL